MQKKIYIGIYFKPKNGGVLCVYDPASDTSPKFWYFKSGDNIGFISKNLFKLAGSTYIPICVHINKTKNKGSSQLATYNQFIGMMEGCSVCRTTTTKIVAYEKVKIRIMQLLGIAKEKDFKSKLLSKRMHENKYNIVYEITKMQSRQSINNHLRAYLLAYYGYLKEKIKSYNKQEQKHVQEKREDRFRKDDVSSTQGDG